VTTYGDLAALAGRPGAARAVGNIMRDGREAGIPYHRVIAAGGALGGYGGNLQLKRELLRAEGIAVGMTRVRGFAGVRWNPKSTKTGSTTKITNITKKRHEASWFKTVLVSCALSGGASSSLPSRPPC